MESIPLNEEERRIYKVIKAYLRENNVFNEREVVPYVNHYIEDFNSRKIEEIIYALMKKHVIVPGTTMTREDILKTNARNKIFEYIRENPGSYLNELLTSLDLGTHQTIWHLKILEKFQFIRSTDIENHNIYFTLDSEPEHDEMFYYSRNEKVRDIINVLKNNPSGLMMTKISKMADMHHETAKKYLRILKELGLVSIVEEDHHKLHQINRESYAEILIL